MARLTGTGTQEIRSLMPAPILQAWNAFYQTLLQEGRIDHSLREMVRIKSADINDCRH